MTAFRHTPYYCEENCYWLAQDARFRGRQTQVVFVSNETRSVAFLHQRAAAQPGDWVVWDYHVVVLELAGERDEARIWDLDSTLGMPIPARTWLERSFDARVTTLYAPRFRLVDAARYIASFASDRRHMRLADARGWQAPPPPWPIIGGGAHVLDALVDVNDETWGPTIDLDALKRDVTRAGTNAARMR